MLKTPFRAQSMEDLYRKVMKGKYPKINKKYSSKFDFIISFMLQLKPEERPTTGDILNLPEIREKIEELNIYPVQKNIFNTSNKNTRVNSSKSRDSSIINNSYQSNSPNNNTLATAKNNKKKILAKSNSGSLHIYSNEISDFETENNNLSKSIDQKSDSKSCNVNYMYPRTPLYLGNKEIIDVLNNNLNYFNQKKMEENKFVLNTIKLPNTLGKLNDKLPSSQYETDYIKRSRNMHGLSFPSRVLPVLKVRYPNDKNSEKENDNNIDNKKSIELIPPTILINNNSDNNKKKEDNLFLKKGKNYFERVNRFAYHNKFKTLKMKVDRDKPFNYRGQIDIIVEE